MEILRRGAIPGKELDVECVRCGSLLRILEADIDVYVQTIEGRTIHYFTCPVCGKDNSLSTFYTY
jgi:transcription elongation factor Elf1